jgi:hypothetical protein
MASSTSCGVTSNHSSSGGMPSCRREDDLTEVNELLLVQLADLSRCVLFISGLTAHRFAFIVSELGADTDPFARTSIVFMQAQDRTHARLHGRSQGQRPRWLLVWGGPAAAGRNTKITVTMIFRLIRLSTSDRLVSGQSRHAGFAASTHRCCPASAGPCRTTWIARSA